MPTLNPDQTLADFQRAGLSDKMKALLVVAGRVQQGGRSVTDEDVAAARSAGADDKAIHDTVLTAAVCCMFNVMSTDWPPGRPNIRRCTSRQRPFVQKRLLVC